MNLFYRSILPFLATGSFLALFLAGCLDAPDYPSEFRPVESIEVQIQQNGSSFSKELKIHPSDSAIVRAKVSPEKYEKDLTMEWIFSSDNGDSLLDRGNTYSFYAQSGDTIIPNKLIITDKEGNRMEQDFSVIVNSLPVLSDSTIPSDKDTLYGSTESAFLFSWYSIDMDLASGDSLFHILELDDTQYDVGTLLQVKQSGFKPGKHKFRVIVSDLSGDTDTLPYKYFYVVDTLEAK